ncbi:MAG: TVP38/TMEM64 family protein [Clostridia bacterium]|nr:TVP38/TMEM64 family protein [Clostridia bacterium]
MSKKDIENVNSDKNIESENKEIKKLPMFTHTTVMLIGAILLFCALDIWCYAGLLVESPLILWAAGIVNVILMGLGIVFLLLRKYGWLKATFIVTLVVAVVTWGYYLIAEFNILEYFTDANKMQEMLESVGWWKYLLFFLFQFLQVTFLPLPAMATTIVGTLMFGPFIATLLSFAGIMLGSIVAFIIGDKCGEKVVAWIVGKEKMEKYSALLFDKGKYMFFLMMLFPIFPDDILCLVAGMTSMSYKFFLTTIFLTRPIGIVMTCYLGSGEIIPFTGWGLAVWGVLIAIMVALFWCAYRYKDKIEEIINKLGEKLKWTFMSKKDKLFAMMDINPDVKLLPENTQTDSNDSKKIEIKSKTNKVNKKKE